MDWIDGVFDSLGKGDHVLLMSGGPGKDPIVATVGKGTFATIVFADGQAQIFTDAKPEMVERGKDGEEITKRCGDTMGEGENMEVCVAPAGHDEGDHDWVMALP